MNVCYLGPLRDYSGYGEANRHAVAALHAAGVNVVGQSVAYVSESSDFGELGTLVEQILSNDAEYQIKILHTTPDEYDKYKEPGKYHIGHFFWETDRVPSQFAEQLVNMDEIWTGSESNKKAIEKSGIETPVYVFPQAIETDREWPEPYEIPEFDGHLFYSIFEWTDRKNPQALLKAYYEEFDGKDNVGLLIKTYFKNFTLQNKRMIRNQVAKLKSEVGKPDYPPVFLYLDLMDRRQVMRIHVTGDCFVSAHRGEGWGIPQVEAALADNPVISTEYGGCHEYFTRDHDQMKIPYELVPLKGMTHSQRWYTEDQQWAEVDPEKLRKAMRLMFDNKKLAAEIGKNGKKLVTDKFNFKTVGKAMSDRLETIQKELP